MPHSILLPASNTALDHDLTTVEAVNEALGLTSSTANDAAVAQEITDASLIIAEVCDRVFAQRDVVETFMLHECWLHGLTLSQYPVTDVASVTASGAAVASTDYKVDPDSGLLWRWGPGGCCGWNRGELVVTYTGGYDLPENAPASLAKACIQMIADARSAASAAAAAGGSSLVRDIQHGDRRVSFFDTESNKSKTNAALTAAVADLIRPFRRVTV